MGCPSVEASTHRSVFALGVLPEDDHIDVTGLFAGQWRFHAWMEIGWADTNALVKATPHGQQQAMQGDVIGNVGVTNSTEQDGVKGFQRLNTVFRHEVTGLTVVLRAPGELGELKAESVGDTGHGLKGFSAFVDDF